MQCEPTRHFTAVPSEPLVQRPSLHRRACTTRPSPRHLHRRAFTPAGEPLGAARSMEGRGRGARHVLVDRRAEQSPRRARRPEELPGHQRLRLAHRQGLAASRVEVRSPPAPSPILTPILTPILPRCLPRSSPRSYLSRPFSRPILTWPLPILPALSRLIRLGLFADMAPGRTSACAPVQGGRRGGR